MQPDVMKSKTPVYTPPGQRRACQVKVVLARNLPTKRLMDTVLRLHWVHSSTQEPLAQHFWEGEVVRQSANPSWVVEPCPSRTPDGCEKNILEGVIVSADEGAIVLSRHRIVLHELSWLSQAELEQLQSLPPDTFAVQLDDGAYYISPESLVATSIRDAEFAAEEKTKKVIELEDLCLSIKRIRERQDELREVKDKRTLLISHIEDKLVKRQKLLRQERFRDAHQQKMRELRMRIEKSDSALQAETEQHIALRTRCVSLPC